MMTQAFPGADNSQTTPELLSPGLAAESAPAFELKFQLPTDVAQEVEDWARRYLIPDPHGDGGTYPITSLYCDTPLFDVFHRSPGYRRNKYRLRRYGLGQAVFLERKKRRGDRVKKFRAAVAPSDLALLSAPEVPPDWPGAWFLNRLEQDGLKPVCRVGYTRTAFIGRADESSVRLTLDRDLAGSAANGWDFGSPGQGEPLLPGQALLELKFHVHLPALFKDLLSRLPVQSGRVSKYRNCVRACGLVPTPPEGA